MIMATPVHARAGWELCAAIHISINSMETKWCNQGAQAVLAREVADRLDAACVRHCVRW